MNGPIRPGFAMTAVILGSTVVFLDATVVNVALESMGADLPASFLGVLEGQAYVTSAYLLALAALLILAGALADRYGRRRLFLVGLAGFGAASVLCGLAPTMETLVAFRFIQGLFGAVLVPTSLAIIANLFTGEAAGQAYGLWTAASGAAFIAGPALGGALVDSLGWRWIFLINVPLVVVAATLALRAIPESQSDQPPRRFDWPGAAAVALAVGGLAYGAIRGEQSGWTDPSAFVALGAGAITTVALVPLMRRRPDPLVPPYLFRSRNFTVTNVSTLLVYGAIYTVALTAAIFLQGTLGYTALAAGLTFIPTGLFLALFSTRVGALAGRLGPRRFMAVGPLVMAVGLIFLAQIPSDSPAWLATFGDPASLAPPIDLWTDVVPGIVLFAAGVAILVAPLTTALMSSVAPRHAGLGSAINNAVSRIGPLLAGALVFVAVTATFYAELESRVPGLDASDPDVRAAFRPLNPPADSVSPDAAVAATEASTEGFHVAMLIAAGLCLAGSAVNAVGIRSDQPPPP